MTGASSLGELATALYGADVPVETTPLPASAPPISSALERLHSKPDPLPAEDLPAEVKALRDGDVARSLYDDRSAFSELPNVLADIGLEGRELEIEHRHWAGVLTDLAVPPAEVKGLATLAKSHAYPDEATAETWQTEGLEALKTTYGSAWKSALADAQALVQRDPRLSDWLNRTGLGNHPRFIAMAADRARHAIANGTLKRTTK